MKIKIVIGILVLLIVLLVVAVLAVGMNLGRIVKAGIENVGPKVTKTTLTVNSVDVSLFAGSAAIKGLELGNPEGYKALQSISVDHVSVSLVPKSVLSDKIIIHSIELKSPEITFEGNPLGKNNLADIMANVNSLAGPVDHATTNAPAPGNPELAAPPASNTLATSPPAKQSKKFQVDDFVITGAMVHAHLTGLINQDVTLPIPDIHFTDLGTGPDGITGADLIQKIINEITVNTVKTLISSASGYGKDTLNALKNSAQGALLSSTNAAGVDLNNLKKGLGNLLGK
jgi:hypothetical protein